MALFILSTDIVRPRATPLCVALALLLSACGGDSRTPTEAAVAENPPASISDDPVISAPEEGEEPAEPEPAVPANPTTPPIDPIPEPVTPVSPSTNEGTDSVSAENGDFEVEVSATRFAITEGSDTASVDLSFERSDDHDLPIDLFLTSTSQSDVANVTITFSDEQLDLTESEVNLQINLGIARAPIQAQTRVFTIVASDGSGNDLQVPITLEITPTPAADVYLQIGQSNMVGSSLFGARQADIGQLDAPDGRITQLNVTGNDSTNFFSEGAFTTPASVANPDALFTVALDPLHDGFNFTIGGKNGTQIGMGLSFARAMLPSTTADIVLVPAAWSDTGFCQTDTLLFPGMGWHATPPSDTSNFSGTLLHDRALTRLNLALQQTGGIFRGIIWHQGEADSNNDTCAAAYETNLVEMVASLRSNAQQDARGPEARGADADVPFIAGTMSFGEEFAILSDARAQVDSVHRQIPELIPFADTVINDDLIPPAFPCGNGSCVHFGATAYREIGARYAELMRAVQSR